MFGSAVSTRDLYEMDLTPATSTLVTVLDGPRQSPSPAIAHRLNVLAEALHHALVAGLHLIKTGHRPAAEHQDGDDQHWRSGTPVAPTATAEQRLDALLPVLQGLVEIATTRSGFLAQGLLFELPG
jgi:hypothetical protein